MVPGPWVYQRSDKQTSIDIDKERCIETNTDADGQEDFPK